MVSTLGFAQRPAAGAAAGLLVLHHGRGADEHDLISFADALDPGTRLHVVAPRAPLTLPGWPGHHWHIVPRVGYPDPDTSTLPADNLRASMTRYGSVPGSHRRTPCSAASRWEQ